MEQTSPTNWVPVDSPAWYSGREVFLGSAERCRGGSLLCDRELSRCLTWLVPHREGSPGCPRVPEEWEQACTGPGTGEAVLYPLAEGLSQWWGALLCDGG